MNQTAKQGLFPWFSLFTGLMGFALRCWLMSTVDAQKLFPKNHISSILSIVLLVLTLGICFYWLLKIPAQKKCKVLFPRSFVAACGNLVGAAGIAYTAWAGRSTSILFFLKLLHISGMYFFSCEIALYSFKILYLLAHELYKHILHAQSLFFRCVCKLPCHFVI